MNSRFPLTIIVVLLGAACAHCSVEAADLRDTAESINETIRANHYHPAELDSDAYRRIEAEVIALGETATSADEFMAGFNRVWRQGPFSHVALRRAEEPAAERLARLDTSIAGDGAVTLAWNGEAAILTVNTMSGADTIAKIDAAYDEIAARGAKKLIIDLRRNTGGAFAVVPLIGHLISEPMDAGIFVSRSWYDDHDEPPSSADFRVAGDGHGLHLRLPIADYYSVKHGRIEGVGVMPNVRVSADQALGIALGL